MESVFEFAGQGVTARGWFEVMGADLKVTDKHDLFAIWVFDVPLSDGVLVLGTNL